MSAVTNRPSTMTALVYEGPGSLRLEQRPLPCPEAGDVLIRTAYVGICATDHEIISGRLDALQPGGVPGHEISGRVIEGTPDLPPGSRVVIDPVVACGTCESCRQGIRSACVSGRELGIDTDGGWAEYARASPEQVHLIPDTVDDDDIPLIEPLACPYGAIAREPEIVGATVAVIGSGIAALNFVQSALACGATQVDAVVTKRGELFEALGARVVEFASIDRADHYDLVIDAVGRAETVNASLDLVRPRGRVLWYGLSAATVDAFPAQAVVLKNLTVVGRTNSDRHWPSLVANVGSGALTPSFLPKKVITPAEAPALFTVPYDSGTKYVIDFT